jgi:hypothetical protein
VRLKLQSHPRHPRKRGSLNQKLLPKRLLNSLSTKKKWLLLRIKAFSQMIDPEEAIMAVSLILQQRCLILLRTRCHLEEKPPTREIQGYRG